MEENNKELKVIVLENNDVKIKTIDMVKIIRIKDEKYNLLIMKDYWPVIGEITGSVSIVGNENYEYDNIKGFYSLSHNVFHLIIQSEDDKT